MSNTPNWRISVEDKEMEALVTREHDRIAAERRLDTDIEVTSLEVSVNGCRVETRNVYLLDTGIALIGVPTEKLPKSILGDIEPDAGGQLPVACFILVKDEDDDIWTRETGICLVRSREVNHTTAGELLELLRKVMGSR